MKHILITGGAGFIGTNLCKKLLDEGCRVTVVDNLITSSGENLTELSKNPNFKFIKHDITKPKWKMVNDKWKIDVIYHLACPTGVPNLTKLAEEMLLTCSIGTQNVLQLALKKKAKLVFTSSSEIYGNPEKFPQNENYTGNVNPIGIRSPYEEGKRFSESLISMYVKKYGLDASIARVFNTYGPLMSRDDSRVIPRFLNQASEGVPLTVEGKGKQTRTFCYVDDLVDGLLLLEKRGGKGEVYNIGSDKEISIKNLAKEILKLTKSRPKDDQPLAEKNIIKYIPRPSHDHNGRRPTLIKIKKLGWKQKTNLKEGLLKTVQFDLAPQ